VRRLLSHTAGLTDGLGYNGFPDAADVQTLEQSLNKAADAMKGAPGRVEIGREPGSRFAYSGGGYTVLQMLIEDVTGQAFARAMDGLVLGPAEMSSSSFEYEDVAARLAPIFNATGDRSPHRFYTALAAASLYTTANDLAGFLRALGRPREHGGLLSAEMLAAMAAPEAHIAFLPVWGLGATINVWDAGEARVMGHDGRNFPAVNTAARLDLRSGDGIVVLATGTDRLASDFADAWVYWQTGRVSLTSLDRSAKSGLFAWAIGLISVLVALVAIRKLSVTR
jgi:CubicO group peptidase (beta-lactamase class C family)